MNEIRFFPFFSHHCGAASLRTILSLAVLIFGVGGLIIIFFRMNQNELKENPGNENISIQQNKNFSSANLNQMSDGDRDGLSDDEERNLGTLLNNPDSDSDGLPDRLEVKTFQTNPLDPDTDDDGYDDGKEIEQGYNPLGKGRLFDFEQGIKNLNQ